MVGINKGALLYKDKPIFGLDIGFSSIKVMQITEHGKKQHISGFGFTSFDPNILKDGVIQDPEALAKAAYELFDGRLSGDITTRRVVLSIPAAQTFTRSIQLPKMNNSELREAVRLDAEQYIPVPVDDLYIDYEIIAKTEENTELLSVAAPKAIIDSYLLFAQLIGLEVAAIETTISAGSRLFVHTTTSDIPTILIDFGSVSSDITIYDKTLIVTSTVPGGGDSFTQIIADTLGVSHDEAHVIKTRYGLRVSKKQKEILAATEPLLQSILKETRRMVRYYEERTQAGGKISQIVTMGGGANIPGLSEWLTDHLRLPVRMSNPWERLSFSELKQSPNSVERSMYVTVAGLALASPKEIHTS